MNSDCCDCRWLLLPVYRGVVSVLMVVSQVLPSRVRTQVRTPAVAAVLRPTASSGDVP